MVTLRQLVASSSPRDRSVLLSVLAEHEAKGSGATRSDATPSAVPPTIAEVLADARGELRPISRSPGALVGIRDVARRQAVALAVAREGGAGGADRDRGPDGARAAVAWVRAPRPDR